MQVESPRSFFKQLNGDTFRGTAAARGPWSSEHCHAGPVAGLMARSAEKLFPELRLFRLSVDLIRPTPLAEFHVESTVVKGGKTLAFVETQLSDSEGNVCAIARTLHLREAKMPDHTAFNLSNSSPRSDIDLATPGEFPVTRTLHGESAFSDHIEVAYPPGESAECGPTSIWMRTLPLLVDETPTPFQSLCPLADCGSGISRNADLTEYTFMNVDLSIFSHRDVKGTWLKSASKSFWERSGQGSCIAEISDLAGPAATVVQTLLLQQSN